MLTPWMSYLLVIDAQESLRRLPAIRRYWLHELAATVALVGDRTVTITDLVTKYCPPLRQDTEYHALSGTRQELCLRKSISNHASSVWNFEIIPTCAAYESLGCFFNVFGKTEGGILLTAVNSFYLVWKICSIQQVTVINMSTGHAKSLSPWHVQKSHAFKHATCPYSWHSPQQNKDSTQESKLSTLRFPLCP